MQHEEEKRNQRKSLYISIGSHTVLLILFFFLLAWKEPFPPIPEYGIELDFGFDDRGSGNIQREAPVTPQPSEEVVEETETTPSEPEVEEVVEEQVEEVTETSEPVETVVEEIESPDVIEESTEEATEPAVEETPEPAAPAVSEPTEEVAEETAPGGGVNQGNDEDEVGDVGKPEGKVDERALLGQQGAGGGASLDMAGWKWDSKPKPDDKSNENGTIKFKITIDDEGYIRGITVLESTVTPAVLKIYRDEVEKIDLQYHI